MANYFEEISEFAEVRQVAIGDPVTGGDGGTVNQSLEALVRRDNYILELVNNCASKDELDDARENIEATVEAAEANLTTAVTNAVPTGTVINFAGKSAPSGYLICNGAAVSRETYADLFAVIGTTYGAGNSTTTFNLPCLTDNRFVEGSTSPGTTKSAGLPNITGTITSANQSAYNSQAITGAFYANGKAYTSANKSDGRPSVTFDASRSSSVYGNSSTVQPKSITLLPCIKY